jgi:hypothetical protein
MAGFDFNSGRRRLFLPNALFQYALVPNMASQLQSRISQLAASFVESVLEAVKTSSLQELIDGSAAHPAELRAPRAAAGAPAIAVPRAARTTPTGRLARRSAEDIAKTLEIVVSLLGSRKNGLRAEQIRSELNMQAKELPRILKEGLSRKKLRAVGQKRATTYFAR